MTHMQSTTPRLMSGIGPTLWSRFAADRTAFGAFIFIVAVAAIGLLAPWLPIADPIAIDLTHKFAAPSGDHLLGADHLGRDVLSRLIWGIRTTLFSAVAAMGATSLFGAFWAAAAASGSEKCDRFMMRIARAWMALPSEVMILAFVGLLGPGLENVVFACVAAKWPWHARMIRSSLARLANAGFIVFPKIAGAGRVDILIHHLLPNILGDFFVYATIDTASVILTVATLSFLGLGVAAPAAEWGMMLAEAKNVMTLHPGLMIAPGLAILLVSAAFSFIGDGLSRALMPKEPGRIVPEKSPNERACRDVDANLSADLDANVSALTDTHPLEAPRGGSDSRQESDRSDRSAR